MGIVVDAHSDMLNDIHPRRGLGEEETLEKYWVPRMREGHIDVRIVALYTNSPYLAELALRRSLDLIATLYEELDISPSAVLCKTHDEIILAKKQQKIALILGMEGAEPLGSDIQLLRIFYTLGLRVLGFTHASRNYLADGTCLESRESGREGGLSNVGIEFLKAAQEMGILIDVSHLNDSGFWDIIDHTKVPIIASHSNCRARCDQQRNLTDEQIKAISDCGGVIGVNACKLFVEEHNLNCLVNHIDHIVKVGGIDHVGLGPDFADYLPRYMSEVERARLPIEGIYPIDGFTKESDFPRLSEVLAERGYSAEDIDLIMGDNFMRVFKYILRN